MPEKDERFYTLMALTEAEAAAMDTLQLLREAREKLRDFARQQDWERRCR